MEGALFLVPAMTFFIWLLEYCWFYLVHFGFQSLQVVLGKKPPSSPVKVFDILKGPLPQPTKKCTSAYTSYLTGFGRSIIGLSADCF